MSSYHDDALEILLRTVGYSSDMNKLSEFRFEHTQAVAAHLRTFSKECGSFAHTIFPGKRIHLRAKFSQVNVTLRTSDFPR